MENPRRKSRERGPEVEGQSLSYSSTKGRAEKGQPVRRGWGNTGREGVLEIKGGESFQERRKDVVGHVLLTGQQAETGDWV